MLLAKEKYSYHGLEDQASNPKKIVRIRKRKKFKLKPAFVISCTVAIVFALGVLLAAQYAKIATTGYKIVSMKKSLAELQLENEHLQSQYNQLQSLDRVEKIATTKLGMVAPNGEGFIYVPVESKSNPKGSKFGQTERKKVVVARGQNDTDNSYIARVTNFVKSWTTDINRVEGESLN